MIVRKLPKTGKEKPEKLNYVVTNNNVASILLTKTILSMKVKKQEKIWVWGTSLSKGSWS